MKLKDRARRPSSPRPPVPSSVPTPRGGRAIIKTDDVLADLGRADKSRQVYAAALFLQAHEIFVERAPIDGQVVAAVEVFLFLDESFVDGRDRFAFAGYFGGHAHHHLAHRARIDQQVSFRLAQHVDEAGRHDHAARIDYALCACALETSDADNPVAFDGEVGDVAGASGAVDDAPVFDQQIVVGGESWSLALGTKEKRSMVARIVASETLVSIISPCGWIGGALHRNRWKEPKSKVQSPTDQVHVNKSKVSKSDVSRAARGFTTTSKILGPWTLAFTSCDFQDALRRIQVVTSEPVTLKQIAEVTGGTAYRRREC